MILTVAPAGGAAADVGRGDDRGGVVSVAAATARWPSSRTSSTRAAASASACPAAAASRSPQRPTHRSAGWPRTAAGSVPRAARPQAARGSRAAWPARPRRHGRSGCWPPVWRRPGQAGDPPREDRQLARLRPDHIPGRPGQVPRARSSTAWQRPSRPMCTGQAGSARYHRCHPGRCPLSRWPGVRTHTVTDRSSRPPASTARSASQRSALTIGAPSAAAGVSISTRISCPWPSSSPPRRWIWASSPGVQGTPCRRVSW